MDAQAWLRRNAPGYELLDAAERKAIRDFALLWSFFESLVLNTNADANRIIDVCHDLARRGRLDISNYHEELAYFRQRYFDGASFTLMFGGLHLRGNDRRAIVEKMLRNTAVDSAEVLAALLIIVLRLRNNLFHGVKWSYGIQGQRENFAHANTVLMKVLSAYHP